MPGPMTTAQLNELNNAAPTLPPGPGIPGPAVPITGPSAPSMATSAGTPSQQWFTIPLTDRERRVHHEYMTVVRARAEAARQRVEQRASGLPTWAWYALGGLGLYALVGRK